MAKGAFAFITHTHTHRDKPDAVCSVTVKSKNALIYIESRKMGRIRLSKRFQLPFVFDSAASNGPNENKSKLNAKNGSIEQATGSLANACHYVPLGRLTLTLTMRM